MRMINWIDPQNNNQANSDPQKGKIVNMLLDCIGLMKKSTYRNTELYWNIFLNLMDQTGTISSQKHQETQFVIMGLYSSTITRK